MLRTTVIAKTDLARSTNIIRAMTTEELDSLLTNQSKLVIPIVEQHGGAHFKGEGDAFWLTFPSATEAALAAIDLQRALRHAQVGRPDQERLSMRIAIAVGDALHKDGDIFGAVMSLTARIESLTPPDEIYLSHAAWLALNHGQVGTRFVDSFTLKGFDKPEHVYRVLQHDVIHTERGQFILGCDLGRFTRFTNQHAPEDIGKALIQLESLALASALPRDGRLRAIGGDTAILTFEWAEQAIAAAENWAQGWSEFLQESGFDLPMRLGIQQGDYYLFRTHFFGNAISEAIWLARAAAALANEQDTTAIALSEEVFTSLQGTTYVQRITPIQSTSDIHERFGNRQLYALTVAKH